MKGRLENIKRSHLGLTERLANPDVIADLNRLRELMSESAQSEDVVHMYNEYTGLMREAGPDEADLKEMAREEVKRIEPQLDALEGQITVLLLPKDENDDRNCLLEIRAKVGEAIQNRVPSRLSTGVTS